MLSIQELGKKFVEAGRLKLRPLCVYGTNDIPQTAIPSHTIDRGIAKAVYTAALFEETPPLYVDASHEQCCPRADGLRLRRSFICRRSRIAYPEKRAIIKPHQ
jgi:hypothetical protein